MERCLNNFLPETELLRDDELLDRVIRDHRRMRHNAGIALRRRLEVAREERARRRQEMNSNAALSANYLSSLKEKVGALLVGATSDLIGWKNIEEYEKVDRRIKVLDSDDDVKVIDVAQWAKGVSAMTNVTDRLTPKHPRVRTSSSPSPHHGGSSVRSQRVAASSPRIAAAAHSTSSTNLLPVLQLEPPPPPPPPSLPPQGTGRLTATRSFSLRRSQPQQQNQQQRTGGGGGGSGGGSTDDSYAANGRALPITQLQVQQAELDFGMLAYGKTHIPIALFSEYDEDASAELGNRRVFFFEFINLLKARRSNELSFADFLEVVYSIGADDAALAVRRWSALDWAVGATMSVAEHIETLWRKATIDGSVPLTFDVFCWLQNRNKNLEERDLLPIFVAADEDRDDRLSKVEFASIFSGKLSSKTFAQLLPVIQSKQQQLARQNSGGGGSAMGSFTRIGGGGGGGGGRSRGLSAVGGLDADALLFSSSFEGTSNRQAEQSRAQAVVDAAFLPKPPTTSSFKAGTGRQWRTSIKK